MDILKGNYKVKVKSASKIGVKQKETLEDDFKKKAIENIGGSMVFVERKKMIWDGDQENNA